MSSGRLPIGHRCFILQVLEVVCACLVGGSLLDSVALYCECWRLCVLSSGRLSIVYRCFILRVLEFV